MTEKEKYIKLVENMLCEKGRYCYSGLHCDYLRDVIEEIQKAE